MAGPYYVRSTDGSDASDGLSWANAKATLAGAFAVMAAGERAWVSQVHAETQATAMTLTSPGTAAAPCEVLCGNDAAEPPTALATTATISTTGASAIIYAGFTHWHGVTLTAGNSTSNASINFTSTSAWWLSLDSCSLRLGGNNTNGRINVGATSSNMGGLIARNTTLSFAHAGQGVVVASATLDWLATPSTAVLGTIPTTLFASTGTRPALINVTGIDLSALASGNNLVSVASATAMFVTFTDCKLGSSVAVTTGAIAGQPGTTVRLVNCDSADTNYRYHQQSYQGTITQETGIIRTGGATDGTTPVSVKMDSTANSKFYGPLVGEWMSAWNETLGAITVTIPVLTDNITLTDADAWVEVEYLGTASFPLGLFLSDRAADILATPANQTTDGVSSWPSAPGTPVMQSLAVTFTPAEKGLFRARVVLARVSTTLYYDPLNEDLIT